jgi:sortase A
VARLAIPRLGIDVVALEGVDPEVLDRGAGHFPGSALPGAPGNASFAGHRDSFFRALGRVEEGDEVRLETPSGLHVYHVTGTQVVGPHQVEVVAPIAGRHLTLVTCYPFDWIGPAPKRFIVRAALATPQAAAEAPPRESADGSLARPG